MAYSEQTRKEIEWGKQYGINPWEDLYQAPYATRIVQNGHSGKNPVTAEIRYALSVSLAVYREITQGEG